MAKPVVSAPMVVASVPPPPSEETVKSAPTAPAPAAVTGAAEFHDRGRKLIQEEKFAASIEPLTQAVKLDPFLSQAFNARGYAYYRLRRFKQAVADFDEAIKLNPMYTNAYVNRGAARRAAGDVHGADIDQTKARQLMKMATQ